MKLKLFADSLIGWQSWCDTYGGAKILRVIRRLLTVGVWGFVVYLAFDFYGMIGTADFDGDTVTGSAALFALGLTVVAALLAIWLINWIFADKESPTND